MSFRIAFDAHDGQGGGRKRPCLAEIVAAPRARRHLTVLDSRAALIEHLLENPPIDGGLRRICAGWSKIR